MTYDISTQHLDPVAIVYQSRTASREEIGGVLAEVLPAVFGWVMENGLTPAGHPFVRYTTMDEAAFGLDAGIPLVAAPETTPPDESNIVSGELHSGRVATVTHKGSYEGLGDAYQALERWVADNGETTNGAPWEVYLTDPGEVPDPADWLTQVFWPIAE